MARSSPRDYPEFYVVGALRAGTKTLASWLLQHPQVFLPGLRAPKYFANMGEAPRPAAGPCDGGPAAAAVFDDSAYRALYAEADGRLRGDISPCYLAHPLAAARIAAARPDARIIIVLRDPVARAFSQYAHHRARGLDPCPSFEEALAAEPQRLASGWSTRHAYAEQSHYVSQLQRFLDAFARPQILFLSYETLRSDPAGTWARLQDHLGLEPAPVTLTPGAAPGLASGPVPPGTVQRLLDRAMPGRLAPAPPTLSERTRRALAGRYLSEHAALRRMTGLTLESWTTPTG